MPFATHLTSIMWCISELNRTRKGLVGGTWSYPSGIYWKKKASVLYLKGQEGLKESFQKWNVLIKDYNIFLWNNMHWWIITHNKDKTRDVLRNKIG